VDFDGLPLQRANQFRRLIGAGEAEDKDSWFPTHAPKKRRMDGARTFVAAKKPKLAEQNH
jgi:hypothetical protein